MNLLNISFNAAFCHIFNIYHNFLELGLPTPIFDSPQFNISGLDCHSYKNLTGYLVELSKKLKPEQFKAYFKTPDNLNINEDNINLINIDNLHEMNTWVKNLNLSSYLWIKNDSSVMPKELPNYNFIAKDRVELGYDGLLKLPTPDLVILCFDDYLFPPCDRQYFDLWIILINSITGGNLDFEDNEHHIIID